MRRLFPEFVDPGKSYFALFVDNKHRALADSGQGRTLAKHAVRPGHSAMRPKIACQRKSQHPDGFFLPGDMAECGVDANAHDLGIEAGKLIENIVECRQLRGSRRAPIEGIKSQEHVLLTAILAELEWMPLRTCYRRQLEVGGAVSNL